MKLIINNGDNSIYLVREKTTKFIYCLKKCLVRKCENKSEGTQEELKISQKTDASLMEECETL